MLHANQCLQATPPLGPAQLPLRKLSSPAWVLQAWIPKLVVLLGFAVAIWTVLLFPLDVANTQARQAGVLVGARLGQSSCSGPPRGGWAQRGGLVQPPLLALAVRPQPLACGKDRI